MEFKRINQRNRGKLESWNHLKKSITHASHLLDLVRIPFALSPGFGNGGDGKEKCLEGQGSVCYDYGQRDIQIRF